MNRIKVNASTGYEVLVGSGLLDILGQEVRRVCGPCRAAVISDSNVWPIYGEKVVNSLAKAGLCNTVSFVFPAGESSKTIDTFSKALEYLAQNHLTRSDCVIALGGGVVGDLAGFTASAYLRGVPYVQVPTTLLAAVDSSVGGKTAIDLSAGKNLAGAFYQPRLVLCDTDTLSTLPQAIFRDGCAEVIKYGVLFDADLFAHLEDAGLLFDRQRVISRCVELKRDVVARDEFDRGERQLLNLGHTLGHGVEANSGFAISHGQAVAIGMAVISRASEKMGYCDCRIRIETLLQKFMLPTETVYNAELLLVSALNDKKRSGKTVNLIIPRSIGNCFVLPTQIDMLRSVIDMGLIS